MFGKEMQFEVAFVRAGGLLIAGSDAVLNGVIAGFADQRDSNCWLRQASQPLKPSRLQRSTERSF
jgi:hypothetical protein